MSHNAFVLGSGGWGSALSNLLAENGHDVTLWSYFQKESEQLCATHENPLLPGVKLNERIRFTCDLSRAAEADLVVFATPSFALRETAERAAPFLSEKTVLVSVTKGIESGSSLRMSQIITQATGHTVVALSGPSHAEEVGRGIPTGCVAACADTRLAKTVQDAFMNDRFRVYTSDDVVGVELGAALKNVIALCAGISDGMGYGDNTKALLITRGLAEIARLGMALGGRKETFAGLTGIGDLIVTCTSMHSRNRRAGILIGEGKSTEEAMREVGAVVEGYYATKSAYELSEKTGVPMPITQKAYKILYCGEDPKNAMWSLMRRNKRSENDEAIWADAVKE